MQIEARMVTNKNNTMMIDKKVDKVAERQDRVEEKLENERERIRIERVVEMRERELRKKNVLIHRMEETVAETTEERREWDIASCVNMFKELGLSMGREAIKFCRRVGERSEEPRPLIVGFYREFMKEDLLDKARDLRDTAFAEVGILPDLTQEQRRDEADLAKEAEKRNVNLNAEDRSKNLMWMVVGRKGEKRLLKGVDRGGSSRGRATMRGVRPQPLPTAPRGSWGPNRGLPNARATQRGRGSLGSRGRGLEGEREELLHFVRGGGAVGRPNRLNSKRLREMDCEDEMDERETPQQPPATQNSQGEGGH